MLNEEEWHNQLKASFFREKRAKYQDRFWSKVEEIGFPQKKDEVFKKFSLKPLFFTAPERRGKREYVPSLCKGQICTRGDELFLSSDMPSALQIEFTEVNASKWSLFLQNRLQKRLEKETMYFPLLNYALENKVLFLFVPPGVVIEEPLYLSSPHTQIFVGKGSQVTFVIQPEGLTKEPLFMNEVFDLHIEENARVECIQKNFVPRETLLFQHIRASVKERGYLKCVYLTTGSETSMFDYDIELLGEESQAIVQGASLLREQNKLLTHIHMDHEAPLTKSNQHIKAVIDDQGEAFFEGKIKVSSVADKTEAYQLNNHLLLSDKAKSHSKPNLEIFTSDVKASHGATCTHLSDDEAFYLCSRGIDKDKAKKMLASGFLEEIIMSIDRQDIPKNQIFNAFEYIQESARSEYAFLS